MKSGGVSHVAFCAKKERKEPEMENNKMSSNRKRWILAIAAIIVLALVISVVVLMPQNNDKTENATGDNELITADGEMFDYDN